MKALGILLFMLYVVYAIYYSVLGVKHFKNGFLSADSTDEDFSKMMEYVVRIGTFIGCAIAIMYGEVIKSAQIVAVVSLVIQVLKTPTVKRFNDKL